MKQPIITVGNLWDYLTGEDPDFEVRDLFFKNRKAGGNFPRQQLERRT
ncbi:MAG: hypothetical protein LBB60_10495 [Desulfovibrio sp.]|jgi:hypothetical protein|nr:hypothetical protein [Desulfovibrio sp.]